MESKNCPYCGVVQDTGVTKEEEGVRKMREWSARYGVDIILHPDNDADKDGFTDMEEYEFAEKSGGTFNPKDADSHPDYLESLFVEGEMKQTFLPFFLQTVSPIPNGWRFNFRDASKKNAYGQATVYSVLKGEEVGKTGFSVAKYEKQTEERVVVARLGAVGREQELRLYIAEKGGGAALRSYARYRGEYHLRGCLRGHHTLAAYQRAVYPARLELVDEDVRRAAR
jgi:hypothetical protein